MTTGVNTSQWVQTAEYYKQSFDLNGRGKITRTPGAEDAATIDGQHISQMDLNVSEREREQAILSQPTQASDIYPSTPTANITQDKPRPQTVTSANNRGKEILLTPQLNNTWHSKS